MELRLEIKLASVEELATVASALAGLQVADTTAAPEARSTRSMRSTVTHELDTDNMIDVESPFTDTPPESETNDPTPPPTPNPAPAPKTGKAPTAAEKKAQKKAQEDADRADRIARLKETMDSQKAIGTQALDNRAANLTASANLTPEESIESIVEEIKVLGDTLMAFNGVDLDGKKALTAQVMTKVGVPAGVRPTQLQQPMLGQFRDAYKAMVNSVVNPVMGGLV